MPSLEMSLGLIIRSKVNWVQNNKIKDKSLLSMSSPAYITFIKFTDTIQDVLKKLNLHDLVLRYRMAGITESAMVAYTHKYAVV